MKSLFFCLTVVAVCSCSTSSPLSPTVSSTVPTSPTTIIPLIPVKPELNTLTKPKSVFYKNCDAARTAGVSPLSRNDPGYRSDLDRDNDGIACE